jgi:hypothetical protein
MAGAQERWSCREEFVLAELQRIMGTFGGIFWIMRPSEQSGLITDDQRQQIDAMIRSLPSFIRQDEERDSYIMGNPDADWPAGIGFTPEGLYIEWDDFTDQWCRDLFTLTTRAQQLGLNAYDIDNGYELIEQEIIDGYGRRRKG